MKWTTKKFVLVGFLVSALLAGGVSLFASGNPDGLERVAIDKGFANTAQQHSNADSILADYGVSLVGDSKVGGALAGVIGIAITGVIAWALFAYLRRKKSDA